MVGFDLVRPHLVRRRLGRLTAAWFRWVVRRTNLRKRFVMRELVETPPGSEVLRVTGE